MKLTALAAYVLTLVCLATWTDAVAGSHRHPTSHDGMSKAKVAHSTTCHMPIHIKEKAEQQPGGALYKGPPVMHHGKHGHSMPEMKGAHMDHASRHGGSCFMAPDKIHHLEGVYSERCGFRLVFYNAMTKPIRADRFRAFIKIVPEKEDEPEVIRFLSTNAQGTVLHADIGTDVSRPFEVELYVKFPESDDPQLFNIHVRPLAQ